MCGIVYNTPMNTIGVGDPVPFGAGHYGSGDNFGSILPHMPKLPKGPKKPKSPKMPKLPFMKAPHQNVFGGMQLRPLIVMTKNKRLKK